MQSDQLWARQCQEHQLPPAPEGSQRATTCCECTARARSAAVGRPYPNPRARPAGKGAAVDDFAAGDEPVAFVLHGACAATGGSLRSACSACVSATLERPTRWRKCTTFCGCVVSTVSGGWCSPKTERRSLAYAGQLHTRCSVQSSDPHPAGQAVEGYVCTTTRTFLSLMCPQR